MLHRLAVTTQKLEHFTAPCKNICIHTSKRTYPDQLGVMLQKKCQLVQGGGGREAKAIKIQSGETVLTFKS